MKPQDVLKHPTNVLTDAQRQRSSTRASWCCPTTCPSHGSPACARRWPSCSSAAARSARPTASTSSRKATARAIRGCTASASPQDQHPTFWEFMTDPVMTDLAADVVGPDVKFHHAKLNVKSGKGTPRLRLAPGHSRLAAHRLQPGHDRHLHRRLHARSGTADRRRRQPRGPLFSMYDEDRQLRGQDPGAGSRLADRRQDPHASPAARARPCC